MSFKRPSGIGSGRAGIQRSLRGVRRSRITASPATRLNAALAAAIAALVAIVPAVRAAEGLSFAVTVDQATATATFPKSADGAQAVSGRLYVFLSQRGLGPPASGPNWFQPEPFFGRDVRDVRPGQTLLVDTAADGFPDVLAKLPAGKYRVQALLDYDFNNQNHWHGVGNLYSDVVDHEYDPARPVAIVLTLNHVVEAQAFPKAEWVHEIALPSALLSRFHKREVREPACVILPAGYDQNPARRYPVIYEIPGFGGTHRPPRSFVEAPPQAGEGETDFIRVLLSGQCKWGHHVYADSATNGPRGEALVREMIPHVDATFRTIPDASGRFVTGHSSGGWSSLWLQVTYPDTFGGVFSTAPDPVDFRDFQQVDLYASPPVSLYYDERNERRPLARQGTMPMLFFPSFARMDDCIGRGGQLRSFEAAFSPLDADGQPRRLWDRQSGRIDPEVARAWEKYDIRLLLERNWAALAPKLAGKLHIYTGDLDTFYLEGAVRKLAEVLKQLGSDAEVVVVPGRDHANLRSPDLTRHFRRQMSERVRSAHPGT